jgi:hypothetical protein
MRGLRVSPYCEEEEAQAGKDTKSAFKPLILMMTDLIKLMLSLISLVAEEQRTKL